MTVGALTLAIVLGAARDYRAKLQTVTADRDTERQEHAAARSFLASQ